MPRAAVVGRVVGVTADAGLWGEDDPRLASSADLAMARSFVVALADDPEVGATAAEVAGFVDAHPDALLRSCAPGHLTGSALVVDAAGERTLVLHHTKLRRWLQPGGHADGDANLAGVALREAAEETGITGLRVLSRPIDVDIHRVAPPREAPHLHHDVRFLVVAPPGARVVGNHESTELRWVDREGLAALDVDAGTLRLADRGFAAFSSSPAGGGNRH